MNDNNFEYGIRCYVNDSLIVADGLIEFCYDYCNKNNIHPNFLNRFTLNNSSTISSKTNYLCCYTNFFTAKLSFWLRDDVQKFLKELDDTGNIYIKRWGDHIIQFVTMQIFMERKNICHFNDWSYEHRSFYKSKLCCGGLYPAIKDAKIIETDFEKSWKNEHNFYHTATFDTYNIKDCVSIKNIHYINELIINNDNFESLNNSNLHYLGKYLNIEDVYLAINDHLINCITDNVEQKTQIQFSYVQPIAFTWFNSEYHGFCNNKLYAINNDIICNLKIDPNITSFVLIKELLVDNKNYQLKTVDSFDWEEYIKHYSDLSFITSKEEAWNHWISFGKNEGRQYFELKTFYSFDWKEYVNKYSDLFFITNKEKAWNHWISFGKNEGRIF